MNLMSSRQLLLFMTGILLLTHHSEGVGPYSDENNETRYATVLDLIASIPHDLQPPCDGLQNHKDCEEVPDGAYQYPNINNCSNFYRCEKQQQINCTCGYQHVFDAATQSCVFGSQTPPCLGNLTVSCSDDNNGGFHLVFGTHCKRYYKCRDNRRIDYQCLHGEIFDVEALSCTSAETAICSDKQHPVDGVQRSRDCENKADGKYAITSNTDKFYVCDKNRKISEGTCQEQQVFVEKLQRCVTVMQEEELSSEENRDRCADRPDGYYTDVLMQCRKFYSCKNGRELFEKECPEETSFDLETRQCQDYDKVSCTQQISKMVIACTDQSDGYHQTTNSHCKKFTLCSSGQKIAELMCAKETSSEDSDEKCPDEGTRECLEAERYVAKENEDCLGKENGEYHPDFQTNCRSFFFCKDGMKMRELSCHQGHIFDSSTKSCQPADKTNCQSIFTVSSSAMSAIDKCHNKVDGFYSDVSIQCKGFYQCKNGRITSELGCQKGQIFDETSQECRPKEHVTCPPKYQNGGPLTADEPLENVCKSKPDGFYPNYLTGCRRYYHCRQFHKMAEYVCTADQLFDPISLQCLPETNVNCSTSILQKDLFDPCRIKVDGYYPNNSNGCHGYYYCRGRTKIIDLMCPPGKLFEAKKGGCSDEATALCISDKDDRHEEPQSSVSLFATESRSSFDCLERFDGLYTDVDEGCLSYHVCVNSQLIKTGQCPEGQLFDSSGQSCKPVNQVICDSSKHQAKNNSTLREVGLHFHFGSACRNTTVCFENIDSLSSHCSSLLSTSNDDQRHRACKIGGLSEMRRKESHDVLASYDCKGKEDGYYTDPDSQCRKWHMCEGGLGTTHECDLGKAFNILHRRCDPSTTVACANQSWVYRNYSFERSFPSFSTQSISKASTTDISNQCLHKSDGIYIDLGQQFSKSPACFSVLLCIRDKAYDVSCPFQSQGLEWGVNCSLADGLECLRDNASTGRTASSTKQPPSQLPTKEALTQVVPSPTAPVVSTLQPPEFSCKNQSNGFYDDRTSGCHTFHVCFDGRLTSYNCEKPLLFDSHTKTCESPEKVQCPLQTMTATGSQRFRFSQCLSNSTSLHPDITTSCQSYFGCIRGRFEYNECPQDKLFDPRTASCNPQTSTGVTCSTSLTFNPVDSVLGAQSRISGVLLSPPPPSDETSTVISFDCNEKPDGFYPDYHQKCHVFYRCVQGKKFSHYCKLGQLFNPQLQSCDFQENVKCEPVLS